MNAVEMVALQESIDQMMEIAKEGGLDFYPMRFEVCPADVLYTFGAYGMPTRFTHWSFGKNYHKMKTEYDFGLSRIYELVINSNPCYAFLLDSNTLLQNKTVCAHVLAHCDFFKNNATFAPTSRDMVERMSATADRVRQYELDYGRERVEKLLDAALALQEHVDASLYGRLGRGAKELVASEGRSLRKDAADTQMRHPYADLWDLDDALPGGGVAASGPGTGSGSGTTTAPGFQQGDGARNRSRSNNINLYPSSDVMLFLIEHSPILEEWERDVLSRMREEMLYFWPQMETKIMNEGWATYWHLRIMRAIDLSEGDAIDFAHMHSGVVLPSKMSINPYHLGLAIWEDIEKRWDDPTQVERVHFGRKPGQGRAKMFEVREMENDVSFLRNYLTKELVDKLDLYLYQKVGNEWRIVETDWEKVRDSICASRTNGGIPMLTVEDGDHNKSGELFIKHAYEGMELDLKQLDKTMPYLQQLWGKNCHLQTVIEGRDVMFTCDGKRTQRKFV